MNKITMREEVKEKRLALYSELYHQYSHQIQELFFSIEAFKEARTIALTVSIHEVNKYGEQSYPPYHMVAPFDAELFGHGLGVDTGIDLPENQVNNGLIGDMTQGGSLLHNTFGQYDNYTPLQMVQYVSTIANGGYRVQPLMVNFHLKEYRQNQMTHYE